MAAIEGVHRFYLLGRRITFYGFWGGAVLWILSIILRVFFGITELILFLGLPLALGGFIWLVAWIIEGFVLPPKEIGKGPQDSQRGV